MWFGGKAGPTCCRGAILWGASLPAWPGSYTGPSPGFLLLLPPSPHKDWLFRPPHLLADRPRTELRRSCFSEQVGAGTNPGMETARESRLGDV